MLPHLACYNIVDSGNACQLFEILYTALEGAIEYSGSNKYTLFEQLLGWTCAAKSHGLWIGSTLGLRGPISDSMSIQLGHQGMEETVLEDGN